MCTSTATVKLISSAERLNEEIDKRDKRIAELEAQEMGFIQTLCSQSEDIGRLKQRIEALVSENQTIWKTGYAEGLSAADDALSRNAALEADKERVQELAWKAAATLRNDRYADRVRHALQHLDEIGDA